MKIVEIMEDSDPRGLYKDLVNAGVEVSSHESDLYFRPTEKALAIFNKYPHLKKNSSKFNADDGSGVWIEVPFHYDPYWEKRLSNPRPAF